MRKYCSVPATLANALRQWLLDRMRGAWPQSWRARCGTTRCIVSLCCCQVVVSKKVEMDAEVLDRRNFRRAVSRGDMR